MGRVIAFATDQDAGASGIADGERSVTELLDDLDEPALPRCVNTADQQLDTATAVELSYDLFILHHVLSLALPVVAATAITVP